MNRRNLLAFGKSKGQFFSKLIIKAALIILTNALSTQAYAASHKSVLITDSVPKFDMAGECRSEGGSTATLKARAEDEADARDQLQPLWRQSSAADKASCLAETKTDGTPSYVELLTCLEMDRDVKNLST